MQLLSHFVSVCDQNEKETCHTPKQKSMQYFSTFQLDVWVCDIAWLCSEKKFCNTQQYKKFEKHTHTSMIKTRCLILVL